MITIARIDERMIHGQVAYAWSVAYKSEAIIVVDDEVAKDAFQKSLLEMACPKGTKCLITSVEKGILALQKYANRKLFVVVRHPETLLKLCEGGVSLTSINVGGLYFKEGRRQIAKTIYVDDDMVETFHKLHDLGIRLETRTTPSDPEDDLMERL